MYLSVVIFVLTKALLTAEVCHALNVTVSPGPVVMITERNNLTLSCSVSQRKRSNSVLILRWFYSPSLSTTTNPTDTSTSPNQFLIAKLGIKKIKLYGNYTRRFPKPKFRLFEDKEGEVFRLWIFNVTGMDQGLYSCKVQEIRKLRDTWRASSNGTSSTQLKVHFSLEDSDGEGLWRLFADVYLCAVLICSMGLLSIFFFTLVLIGQYLYRRHRLKTSYLLVKCPESSSGETVTSSSSSSSSSPKAPRRETKPIPMSRKHTPPKLPLEPPPHIQAKVPVAAKRPRKPRRSKTPQQRAVTPRGLQDDSLTYAELELVRPRPEPPTLPNSDQTPSNSDTVYAQILFQEKQQ